MKLRAIAVSVLGLAVLGMSNLVASAATLSYNYDFPSLSAGNATAFSIAKFDTLGGQRTLTSAELTLTGTLADPVTIKDTSGIARPFLSLTVMNRYSLRDGANNELLFADPSFSAVTSLAANGTKSFTGFSNSVGRSLQLDDAGLLAAYFTGTDQLSLNLFTSSANILPFATQLLSGNTGSAHLTVTYNFVPEPSTLAGLASLALVGLGIFWRRRK